MGYDDNDNNTSYTISRDGKSVSKANCRLICEVQVHRTLKNLKNMNKFPKKFQETSNLSISVWKAFVDVK